MDEDQIAKDCALTIFMALRRYLPEDKERAEWCLRSMETAIARAITKVSPPAPVERVTGEGAK